MIHKVRFLRINNSYIDRRNLLHANFSGRFLGKDTHWGSSDFHPFLGDFQIRILEKRCCPSLFHSFFEVFRIGISDKCCSFSPKS